MHICKVFIANRGEICRRVAAPGKKMGMQTVTLYAGKRPPAYLEDITQFVQVSDETAAIYLNQEFLISIAKETGCDAVHPGFGFLSENADFAQAVTDAGLIWIGPKPDSIRRMASKGEAQSIARNADVPCLRGIKDFDPEKDLDRVREFAAGVGYPLLVKASLGGGGKGMRVVRKEEELESALLRARSEAEKSFGDGNLICEQFLENARHVEVQLLGDHHGCVVAIGDRDCSLQRRHQKVIEEAPAPCIPNDVREKMHAAAVSLGRAVGYCSTGTVEFLLDWSDPNSDNPGFYFLEMNTRLQVEHPVTEEVYGIDLVEWQLRVAQNEELPEQFNGFEPDGHSVELRIYAEDVEKNFLPASGEVSAFYPKFLKNCRWEFGLDNHDVISDRFDPMIAKLVTKGRDRAEAIRLASSCLNESIIASQAATNVDFLQLLLAEPFQGAPLSTTFIESNYDVLMKNLHKRKRVVESSLDVGEWVPSDMNQVGQVTGSHSHEVYIKNAFSKVRSENQCPSESDFVLMRTQRTQLRNSETWSQSSVSWAYQKSTGERFWFVRCLGDSGEHFWRGNSQGQVHEYHANDSLVGLQNQFSEKQILAPVPGKVISIASRAETAVETGAQIMVLESMKMEFEIKAEANGVIKSIHVAVGDQITSNQVLAELE